jgi:urease accessory protein
MSAVTLLCETRLSETRGRAALKFVQLDGESRLAELYQHDPLRVLFPEVPADEPPCAAIVTTSGGLVGGDVLDIEVSLGPGARALVMPQAAEKVYRSAGADCRVDVALTLGAGGWLEWLPQETILFDGARLRRLTRIDMAPGARVFAGEMLVFGRTARGERLTTGLVRDAWEIRRDGRLIWADALHLDDGLAGILAHPAGFDGAVAAATTVYVDDGAGQLLDVARELLPGDVPGLRTAATVVNGVLITRWIGRDARRLRHCFGRYWAGFRARAAGLPARLPRLWEI